MNKNNISPRNNQGFYKDNLSIAYWLGGSVPAMFVPEHVSGKIFTESRRKMTEEVFRHMNANDIAFPSHTTIAAAAGLKRQAALEYLNWAEEVGIFKIVHRAKQWDSNIYFLGDVLKDYRVRWSLRNVFNGLHRVFSKTIKVLNEAANIAKRTLLLNNNVFKKNTSKGDYKEIKLHTSPYIENKKLYYNTKKALWADWSINEDDYRREIQMLDQNVLLKIAEQEDIRKDRKYQQFKRNDAKYPTYYSDMVEKFDLPPFVHHKKSFTSDNSRKISQTVMQERLVLCNAEMDFNRRLAMFQRLKDQVERASIPYIQKIIDKTHKKIADAS